MSLLLLGAGLGGSAPPANPTWHANQGTTTTGTTNTGVITTLVDLDIGDLLVIHGIFSTNRSISSIVDSVGGNTWASTSASGSSPVGTDRRLTMSYSRLAAALPAGTTVTFTYSGTCVKSLIAQSFKNIAASPLDLTGTAEVGGTASVVQSAPGTMAQAVEMQVGAVFYETSENPVTSTFTADAGWANSYNVPYNTFGRLTVFTRLVTDGTSVGATGTISTTKNWIGRIHTFKGA